MTIVRFIIALLIILAVGEILEARHKEYAWTYAIIIVLGMLIFNAGTISRYFNRV